MVGLVSHDLSLLNLCLRTNDAIMFFLQVQLEMKCCGNIDYHDWLEIQWFPTSYITDDSVKNHDSVPYSCCNPEVMRPCIHENIHEGLDHSDYDHNQEMTIFTVGCHTAFVHWYKENMFHPISYGLIIIMMLHIGTGVFYAIIFGRKYKKLAAKAATATVKSSSQKRKHNRKESRVDERGEISNAASYASLLEVHRTLNTPLLHDITMNKDNDSDNKEQSDSDHSSTSGDSADGKSDKSMEPSIDGTECSLEMEPAPSVGTPDDVSDDAEGNSTEEESDTTKQTAIEHDVELSEQDDIHEDEED